MLLCLKLLAATATSMQLNARQVCQLSTATLSVTLTGAQHLADSCQPSQSYPPAAAAWPATVLPVPQPQHASLPTLWQHWLLTLLLLQSGLCCRHSSERCSAALSGLLRSRQGRPLPRTPHTSACTHQTGHLLVPACSTHTSLNHTSGQVLDVQARCVSAAAPRLSCAALSSQPYSQREHATHWLAPGVSYKRRVLNKTTCRLTGRSSERTRRHLLSDGQMHLAAY